MSAGYLRQCANKIRHPTRELAEAHRRSMVSTGKWAMRTSNTYRCMQCGSYHAGRTGVRNRGRR
jgi:hypothetical protein